MAIIRNFRLPQGIGVSADFIETFGVIQSSNPGSGAIVSRGGVGVGNSISIGGRLQLFNGSFYTAFTSSASGNTVYTLPSSSPATGTSVLQSTSDGIMSWVPMIASSSGSTATSISVNSASTNAIHYLILSPSSSGSGVALSTGNPLVYNPSTKILSVSGLAITSTTPSSSSTTGALVVAGGVGIGDSLYVGSGQNGLILQPFVTGGYGAIYSTNITPSTSNASFLTNGSAALLNGVTNVHLSIGAQQKLSVDTSTITIKPTTGTGSSASGALVVTGGAAVGQSLSIGGRLQIFNATNYAAFRYTGSGSTVYILPTSSPATGSSVLQSDSSGVMSWVPMTASGAASGITTINSLTDGIQYFATGTSGSDFNISSSGSTHTFNIPIAGSASTGLITTLAQTIAGQKTFTSAIIGDLSGTATTAGFASTSNYSYQSGYGITAGFATTAYNINLVSAITNTSHPVVFSPSSSGSGVALSSNTTLSFNPSTNIMSVSGLAVTAGTSSTSTSTGALIVSGGVGIGGTLFVGTTISVNSGSNGLLFQKLVAGNYGAIYSTGVTPSTTNYTMITDGASVNFNGTNGVYFNISNTNKIQVTTNNINIVPTAASTSTSTGALTVAGGVGIGGSLYVASATAISGITINNGIITGNLTGTATTAQNINVANASTNSAHPLYFSPSATGSGLATSSNTTLSYNPSSLVLSTSGLAITASTASTNSSTGALVVTGGVGIGGSLYVAGDLTINGTTTTINSVTLTVDDKNIELGSVLVPSDVTAEGGGITLKGATDKSINWYTGTGWSSSESWNLVSGNSYKINNTTVLSNSSLGTGVTNSSLTAVGTISTGVWAGTLITALYGGTGYNSYTKGDLLVGAGSTLIKFGVGSDNQLIIANSSSGAGLSWATFANPTYGSFYSTATQQVAGAGVSTPVKFNATYEANRVSIYGGSGTSSRIQIQDPGPFSITFSAQINLVSGNQPQKGDFWFRVNGQDIPRSNSQMSITGKDYETLATVNFVYTFALNDYFEVMMSSSDPNFSIEYLSGLTSPPRPDVPSIILSVLPITHIVGASGSGISGILSLNGANVSQQYLLTGTSGSDFNITTALGNHTFNIPIAGTGATGLLTSQNQTIGGLKTFASGISITASTASTSTSTGALTVTGGVGIGGSLYVSSATGISGVLINNGVVTGSLTGTATTATNVNVVLANTNASHPLLFTPTSGSASGIAVSSNTTLIYNPSTDILSVSGLAVTSSTASTTTTTGSFIATGGVGIGLSASIGGRLQLFNSSNYTAFVSSASGNTVYTLPATSPATGSSVLQSTSAGVMSWVPMTAASSSGNTAQNVVVNGAGNANVFHPILFTPSSLSAGSAVSSDTTISFNPSTEILNVSGLAVTSGTASTNTTTGALVVKGGLGVTGQLSFAQASFGFTGITTNPTMSFIGATSASPITLTVLTDNSLSFEGSQGSVFSIDSNLSSGEIFSVSDISGLPIISASAGQTVNINEFGGYTQIGNGLINSSSTTTGSLVIAGGLGMSGNANIGGTVRISNGTNSSSTTSGAFVVLGGLGITGNAFIGGTTTVTNTTASITPSSGSWVISGGVGIGQSASIGGRLQLFNGLNYTALVSSASGNTVYTLPAASPAVGTSVLVSTSGGVWSWAPPASVGNSSGGTVDGTVQFKSGSGFAGTNSLFFDTNVLGLRISGFPGGNTPSGSDAVLKLESTIGSFNGNVNGTYIAVNAPTGFAGDLMNLQVNAVSKFRIDNTGAATAGTFNFTGTTAITNGLNSSSTTTGTLTVAGGVGVTGNAFIGGTTSITNTTASTSSSTGALTVSGGVGIGQTLFVGGNLVNSNYLYSGGNNFTKAGQAQGDIFLDNNTNDTPGLLYYYKNNTNFGIDVYAVGIGATRLRIVRDLNESTGSEIWSIDRNGVVARSAWDVGEVINTRVYNNSDLGMSATTTINSTTYTNVAAITYTPKSSTSYLWIEFDANYDYSNGTTNDDFFSRITVGGSVISERNQIMVGQVGGGTRSGVIFPISGRYTNSATSGIAITVQARWGSADDPIRVYGSSTSGYMRIQEIGR